MIVNKTLIQKYVKLAIEMREKAYCPYSKFSVGAVLVTKSRKVFTGCNVENVSYPNGCCAEKVAITKAISEGYKDFKYLFIAGGKTQQKGSRFTPPCGACRQIMSEFVDDEFKVVLIDTSKNTTEYQIYTIKDLLPESFK